MPTTFPRHSSAFWAGPHPPTWIAEYVASAARPYREDILDALAMLAPFASVYELGCHAGPMLTAVRTRWPDVTLAGCDVSAEAVAQCSARLNAGVIVGDLRAALPTLATNGVDVILTCYTLAYVSASDLPTVLREVRRVARVGCVFAEPMDLGDDVVWDEQWDCGTRHKYLEALAGLSKSRHLRTLRRPWHEGLNAVLAARW